MVNETQKTYWNEIAGPKWLGLGGAMEARLAPVNDALIEAAALQPGEHVLDVGCGAGFTSLEAAHKVGPHGHVLGVDISHSMLEAARELTTGENAGQLEFALADAQTEYFTPPVNVFLSRFGVMFFDNPVAAFANLRRSAAPGARLAFAAWAPLADNIHWAKPLALVQALLGPGEKGMPRAAGPLAFDDPDYVLAILRDAGWSHGAVRVQGLHLRGVSLDEEAQIACTMGPSGALLDGKHASLAQREMAYDAIRTALPGYAQITPDGVRLAATIHLITARAM
ncbi:MAG: methyltransferase domain-containing protein [Rhodospirillales bacterium]|nr:methyltransferase domain-containing protein [Rhodospirillales bacterium]